MEILGVVGVDLPSFPGFVEFRLRRRAMSMRLCARLMAMTSSSGRRKQETAGRQRSSITGRWRVQTQRAILCRSLGLRNESCSADVPHSLFAELWEIPIRGISLDFEGFKWSEREDLNLRPPVPQTGALTGLRYAPFRALWGQSQPPSSTVTERTHTFRVFDPLRRKPPVFLP